MDLSKHYDLDYDNDNLHLLEELLSCIGLSLVDILIIIRENPSPAQALSSKLGIPIDLCKEYLHSLEVMLKESLKPEFSLPSPKHISTGLPSIDYYLQGGCAVGQVTEVFGASGTGKSQFLINLAVKSQNLVKEMGNPAECIYISTEAGLETRRLVDFAKSAIDIDNITYIHCSDMDNQDHVVFTQLKAKLTLGRESERSVGAVVIDSISHHLRASEKYLHSIEYLREHLAQQEKELGDDSQYAKLKMDFDSITNNFFKADKACRLRAAKEYYLLQLYRYLEYLAQEFEVAIIISNQVSDAIDSYTTPDILSEERLDLLNYDFQVGTFSGWDLAAFEFEDNEPILQPPENALVEKFAGLRSEVRLNDFPLETSTQLPKSQLLKWKEIPTTKIKFIGVAQNRKRRIPALGYLWAKLIPRRILLWKKYQWNRNLPPTSSTQVDQNALSKKLPEKNEEFQDLNNKVRVRRFARVISPTIALGQEELNIEFEILSDCIQEV